MKTTKIAGFSSGCCPFSSFLAAFSFGNDIASTGEETEKTSSDGCHLD
jgi:hypothetical protein